MIEIEENPKLFRTDNYVINVVQINIEGTPVTTSVRRKYVVTHETHGVVIGFSESYAKAIQAAQEAQAELDAVMAQVGGSSPGTIQ